MLLLGIVYTLILYCHYKEGKMKTPLKLFGLIVFITVIGFIMPMELWASGSGDKGGGSGAAEANAGGGTTKAVKNDWGGGDISHLMYINEWMGMNFKANNEQEYCMNNGSGVYEPVTKGTWSINGNILTWTDTHKSSDGGKTWTPATGGAQWTYEVDNNTLYIDINKNGVDPWALTARIIKDDWKGGDISVVMYVNEWMGMNFKANNEQEYCMNNGSGVYDPVTKGTWSTSGNILTWTDTHKSSDGGKTWTSATGGVQWTYEVDDDTLYIDINKNGVDPWVLIANGE